MEKLRNIPFQAVDLDNGFWQDRQRLNSQVTIPAVLRQFKNTGRFDAFRCDWQEGKPNKPHIFYDSDVAKWIESAAFLLEKEKHPELEAEVDAVVDLIERHQDENGYFNIYFTNIEPSRRFTRRRDHELYCAGHLIEGAVAYYKATGKDKFLRQMCRYVDHIEKVFKDEAGAAFYTPGHQEIELALVKLYEVTGEKRYLDLGKWFIDTRGTHPEEGKTTFHEFNERYAQDHLPVREQDTAEGHSVRLLYMCSGMADIAAAYGDESLLEACRRLFDNTTEKRMYITGGVGSSRYGEAFTKDYDLYNVTAYTESCAAIALAMFGLRMLKMETDSKYADAVERALYNGFLSSTSLDGKSFFYENPLAIDLDRVGRDTSVYEGEVLPITQRVEVFSCSCCPPNITRFVASLGDYLYTYDDSRIYVHQFMPGTARVTTGGREVEIRQQTSYPNEGVVTLDIRGAKDLRVGLRIPGWCDTFTLLQADGTPAAYRMEKGYAMVECGGDEVRLVLSLEMPVRLYEANARVHDDLGRVAMMRGPVVYCLEGMDNEQPLYSLLADRALKPELSFSETYGMNIIQTPGWKRVSADPSALYLPLSSTYEPVTLTFIPYFTFANRGESDMLVWVPLKG